MIVCQGLRAGYGRRVVLSGLDLTVAAGEMVGLLGPNGAGKTTLLLTLTGAIDPLGGRVRLGGREVSELSPRHRAKRVAAVPQRLEAVPGVTVRALVLMISWRKKSEASSSLTTTMLRARVNGSHVSMIWPCTSRLSTRTKAILPLGYPFS